MSHKILKGFKQMANTEGYGKIIISVILGAAIGIATTYMTGVSSNKGEIIRLTTEVTNLTSTVKNLTQTIERRMLDRYTGADAKRDFDVVSEKLMDIKARDSQLEADFKAHLHNDILLEARLDAEIDNHAREHRVEK